MRDKLRLIVESYKYDLNSPTAVDDLTDDITAAIGEGQEPVAWLDLSKLSKGGMAYATAFKTTPNQVEVFATPQRAPDVAAMQARIVELEAKLAARERETIERCAELCDASAEAWATLARGCSSGMYDFKQDAAKELATDIRLMETT